MKTTHPRIDLLGALAALALFTAGCGASAVGGGDFSGDLGATPGGAQDISQARQAIDSGQVPTTEQFTIEGLYSEHDLSLAAPPPCARALCVGTAAGLEIGLDDDQRDVFVQLGLSSDVSAENFQRKPLNLGVVIDTSGSMAGVLPGVKDALHALVDHMRQDDRLAIVVFESTARTIQPSTPISDKTALHAAINTLATGGSTALEEGMRVGYDEIDGFVDADHLSRLMVFTDAMPNVGGTEATDFEKMAEAAAAQDIGLTFFGFGPDFSSEFVDQIAHVRGGNYRFVRPEDVKPIFSEELDFLVTPIAYDLKVKATPPATAPLRHVYGVPQAEDHVSGDLFDVSTVFLSKRKGAIVLRLDGASFAQLTADAALDLGVVDLSYTAMDGTAVTDTLAVSLPVTTPPAEGKALYPNPEIARTLAVTDEYLAMYRVCDAFHKGTIDTADAGARLDAAIEKLTSADASLHDPNLTREITMLGKLKAIVSPGGSP
jgi:Ca-activated chloride channel family protein